MKKLGFLVGFLFVFFLSATPAFAEGVSADITNYTKDTLNIIILIATASAVFFLIKGGYLYAASTGKPEMLESAKKTIRNAIIGLVLVLAAGVIVSFLQNAIIPPSQNGNSSLMNLAPLNTNKPTDGLTQVLIDAITAFFQNIVESATKPLVDAILGFLTTTPNLLTNSVIFKFWTISLGIVDSLFVLVVALLGLQFMSASSFGFEEIELKHLLPRIGLSFLGANTSLFLADYIIVSCNALVNGVLHSTGGLNHAWIVDAINPVSYLTGTTPLITLIFLVLFLIVSIVLLMLYISRLISISLAAVLSPFVFLLWAFPKFSDFAEIATKTYIATVFIVFIHVVVIQLASSFLALPEGNANSILSIAIAIGLFLTLLRIPPLLMYMVMYTSRNGTFKKLGGQIINVITTDTASSPTETQQQFPKKQRKVVYA